MVMNATNEETKNNKTTGQLMANEPKKSSAMKATTMDEFEDRLEEVGIVQAPDGGYGWVVVLASFCSNAIVDGIIFTVSASLVPRWEQYFQSNAVTTITALLAGFYLLAGPLASALANFFGCNTVAIAGSFIAAIGFLISALIPALPVLYFAFGIIGGLGFGLIFLPAIVIVGQYFSEKRALATGIAVCGSGIGTAIFGQINPILLRYFDTLTSENESWRIFLLFLSAVTLSCAIFGYFFKPLKPSKAQLEQVVRITAEFMGMEETERTGETKQSISAAVDDRRESSVLTESSKVPTGHLIQGVEIERFDKPPQNGTLVRKRKDSFSQRPFLSTLELLASRQAIDRSSLSNANLALEVSKAGVTDMNRPLSRMDIFYGGSTMSLANRLARKPARADETAIAIGNAIGGPKSSTVKSTLYLSTAGLQNLGEATKSGGGKWSHGIFASFRSMLDLSLLQSPTFIILAFSGFLTLFCFFIPFAFIGALADERIKENRQPKSVMNETSTEKNGTDQNSSQILLVLLGLANVGGRVLCGFIADHPKVDPLVISNLALIIGGIATALAPMLDQLWMFSLYCFPFAFGAASFAALRSIICVELLGIERLTSAFGMLMLFMGVAALLGPPFARLLKNFTGSYGLSFHIMGIVMAGSGFLCVPLRKINEWNNGGGGKQRNETKDDLEANSTELQPLDDKKING